MRVRSTDAVDDDDSSPKYTRRKSPLELLSGIGGAGSVGLGVFILNMLVHQTNLLDEHGEFILDNRRATERVGEVLGDMRKEFEIDIQAFKIKHLEIQDRLHDLELIQTSHRNRMEQVERLMNDPKARPDAWTRTDDDARMREHVDSMKDWTRLYFEPKKAEQ